MRNSLKYIRTLLLFSAVLTASMSNAQTPSTLIFGPEWTFTNEQFLQVPGYTDRIRYVFDDLETSFQSNCKSSGKCKVEREERRLIKITFTNGFQVHVTADEGVLELQSSPVSLSKWRQIKDEVQSSIFQTMSAEGFHPHEREGAGHVNVGLKFFENNPLLLRNFIVDFYNHNGMSVALNSLVDNSMTAKTLDQYNGYEKKQFIKKLQKLDSVDNFTVNDVLKNLGEPLYAKFIALGLRDIGFHTHMPIDLYPTSRLEIRTLRPQSSMDDYIRVLEIFEARIQYLSHLKTKIKLGDVKPIHDGYEALGQFADYLEESGLDFRKYKSLLPEVWRSLPESNYIRDLKKKFTINRCEKLF
jgi:hypothetical protein